VLTTNQDLKKCKKLHYSRLAAFSIQFQNAAPSPESQSKLESIKIVSTLSSSALRNIQNTLAAANDKSSREPRQTTSENLDINGEFSKYSSLQFCNCVPQGTLDSLPSQRTTLALGA